MASLSPPPIVSSPVEDLSISATSPTRWKGKGRETDTALLPDDIGLGERPSSAEPLRESSTSGRQDSYPPLDDELLQERKVAENLERWELQEKQRRKAARESRTLSISSVAGASNSRSDITRRGSLFWSTSKRKPGPGSRPIPLDDSATPRSSIDGPVTASSPSPFASQTEFGDQRQRHNPSNSTDSHDSTATITPGVPNPLSSSSQDPFADNALLTPASSRTTNPFDPPNAQALTSTVDRRAPTPRPLGLPTSTPSINSPPESVRGMSATLNKPAQDAEEPDPSRDRWWTDWLCGCRESRDRQDGKTNPFE